MPIDFHDPRNRMTYTGRTADPAWLACIDMLAGGIAGKRAADLGSSGGIYTEALIRLGAAEVTALDYSAVMTAAAADYLRGFPHVRLAEDVTAWTDDRTGVRANVRIVHADAADTGLPDSSCDLVLARALIHHVTDLDRLFREVRRILAPGGMLIIQDRTAADCLLPGSPAHLRGYLFELYPKLIPIETGRRPEDGAVRASLAAAGFEDVRTVPFAEPRRTYASITELREELLSRRGRSILHALDDGELEALTDAIGRRLADAGAAWPLTEHDHWTFWIARTHR